MREQNCRNARQPACDHRRVLAAVVSFFFSHFVVSWLNVENLFILLFCQSTEKVVRKRKGLSITKSSCVFRFFTGCQQDFIFVELKFMVDELKFIVFELKFIVVKHDFIIVELKFMVVELKFIVFELKFIVVEHYFIVVELNFMVVKLFISHFLTLHFVFLLVALSERAKLSSYHKNQSI